MDSQMVELPEGTGSRASWPSAGANDVRPGGRSTDTRSALQEAAWPLSLRLTVCVSAAAAPDRTPDEG